MIETLKRLSIRSSLSMQLLLLTIFFVLLAEVLIYVPSIVNYRKTWLEERLAAANIAILAIEAAPDHMISEMLSKKLLDHAGVVAITLKRKDKRHLILNTDQPLNVAMHYDIRKTPFLKAIQDTMKIMFHAQPHGSLIQVKGKANFIPDNEDTYIEIILYEDFLCEDMATYSFNVMLLSIIISLITAGLLYFSLSYMLIRPIKTMTRRIVAFRSAPERVPENLSTNGRADEIGIIMLELTTMQHEIREALIQKKHLTQLGESVSKINHDLRNILSSAQMVSDHLSTIDNPIVQKLAPRFVTAVDRAIRLCENTLKYGRSGVETPELSTVQPAQTVNDVALSLGISELKDFYFNNELSEDFTVEADGDQIFRVLLNLSRNALQAMKDKGEITFTSHQTDKHTVIDIIDNGPGIPARIKDSLFQPFHGSSNGGAGLGLAISKEIIEAHGGILELLRSDDTGSHFRISLKK
ncbi:MAG: HAMP domain-containing histidine kinase [Emcibacter sp.]|nr:HAMP domain-containing histidine kinase [Emcibacter sp.]